MGTVVPVPRVATYSNRCCRLRGTPGSTETGRHTTRSEPDSHEPANPRSSANLQSAGTDKTRRFCGTTRATTTVSRPNWPVTQRHDQERRQLSRKEQPDYTPTRLYHSIMFIHDSLGTGAFSNSPALYCVFNVPPDPRGPTAACWRHPSGSLSPSGNATNNTVCIQEYN